MMDYTDLKRRLRAWSNTSQDFPDAAAAIAALEAERDALRVALKWIASRVPESREPLHHVIQAYRAQEIAYDAVSCARAALTAS